MTELLHSEKKHSDQFLDGFKVDLNMCNFALFTYLCVVPF